MKKAIELLSRRQNLPPELMREAMRTIMLGDASEAEIAAFLVALTMKGETVDEVTNAVIVIRELSDKVVIHSDDILVDPVGTGGDKASLFNVSTASAIMASAAGVKIAKHGNIAASSASGSADVLKELGMNLQLASDKVETMLNECGFAFMFAQKYHSAMRHVVGVRKALGIRTLFNVIGPLANPAGVKHQVLGVYSLDWLQPMVEVAKKLGSSQIIGVHAANGLDEFSVTDVNHVCHLKTDGRIENYIINPKDFGMDYSSDEALKVKNAKESLALIKAVFAGEGPDIGKDMLVLNTAAILIVAEKAASWQEGVDLANKVIKDGAAFRQLSRIVNASNALD